MLITDVNLTWWRGPGQRNRRGPIRFRRAYGNHKDTKTQRKRANKGLLTRVSFVSFVSLWLLTNAIRDGICDIARVPFPPLAMYTLSYVVVVSGIRVGDCGGFVFCAPTRMFF